MPNELRVEEPCASLSDHPAARAWARLGGAWAEPCRIVVLKPEKKRSAVYRLQGESLPEFPVIAKRGRAGRLSVEFAIYREVLSRLPLQTLRCFGLVADEDSAFAWLFLEDAGETRFSSEDREHRALAAQWFAVLHAWIERRQELKTLLPVRGLDHYRSVIARARDTVCHALRNPAVADRDRAVLATICAHCDAVADRWREVEEICRVLPHTLVHGDFSAKNVRMRGGPGGLSLFPLDWDDAGWGTPGADLSQTDILVYWSAIRNLRPSLGFDAAVRFTDVGRIFWALDPVSGEMESLVGNWPENATRKIRAYAGEIARSLDSLGWSRQ